MTCLARQWPAASLYSWLLFATPTVAALTAGRALADDAPPAEEDWAIHGQSTFVGQYHPAFTSPYRGPQSLDPGSRGDETLDVTLYAGVRPWSGAEIWLNPEMDQGFGLSNTLGVAGFPSAEAYKIGEADPYYKMQRGFFRQTIDLGGQDASRGRRSKPARRHDHRESGCPHDRQQIRSSTSSTPTNTPMTRAETS